MKPGCSTLKNILNTSTYPPLFVQSDDHKQSIHYRNTSFVGNDIWIEQNHEVNFTCFSAKASCFYLEKFLLHKPFYREAVTRILRQKQEKKKKKDGGI
jgi:hypothetical protein